MESGDRRRGQDVAAATTRRGQDIHSADTRFTVTTEEAGRNARMAPEINPGNRVVVPPNSPLASRADAYGFIQGNPSLPVEQGAAARALRENPAMPPAELEANRRVLPGAAGAEIRGPAGGGAGRPALDVNPNEAARLTQTALALLGDTVDGRGAPNGVAALTPEAQAWVQQRAASLYQQTRDAGSAAEQAAREFRSAWQVANPRAVIPTPDQVRGWGPRSPATMDLPPALRGPDSGGRMAPAATDMPRPRNPAERDRLPPGTRDIAPDGSVRTRGAS